MRLKQFLFFDFFVALGKTIRLSSRKTRVIAFAAFFFAAGPVCAEAASLRLLPSNGTHAVGGVFTVSVVLSSPNQAVNAVSGTFSFPPEKLEVVSLSKSGSVLGLWIQDPIFSNTDGTVHFEGVALNPGFQGVNGKIASISFRVKSEGAAEARFLSGSILANDGQGTEVLSSLVGANFTFETVVGSTEARLGSGLSVPKIVSTTHPDQDAWYAARDAVFSWSIPSGVDAVRLLIGSTPDAMPTVSYAPAISSKIVRGVKDGVWYFHAQFKKEGVWGGVGHYRFQVDTEEPERFEIHELESGQLPGLARFLFDAQDRGSGISRYEVRIDGGQAVEWRGGATSTYETPRLVPGPHMLNVRAFDRAGQYRSAMAAFVVSENRPRPHRFPDESEFRKRADERSTPSKIGAFWLPFAAGTATAFLILMLFYLFSTLRRLRLRIQKAVRTGRHETVSAFQDLRKGASIQETEKQVLDAIDRIGKRLK